VAASIQTRSQKWNQRARKVVIREIEEKSNNCQMEFRKKGLQKRIRSHPYGQRAHLEGRETTEARSHPRQGRSAREKFAQGKLRHTTEPEGEERKEPRDTPTVICTQDCARKQREKQANWSNVLNEGPYIILPVASGGGSRGERMKRELTPIREKLESDRPVHNLFF